MSVVGMDTSRNSHVNFESQTRRHTTTESRVTCHSYKQNGDVKAVTKKEVQTNESASNNGYLPRPSESSSHQHNHPFHGYGSLPSSSNSRNERSHRTDKMLGRNGVGSNSIKQPPRSMKSNSLHRSNSSLDLDRAEEVLGSVVHKEYGSASSIDIIAKNKESFFSMLQDFCNDNLDQRSPGPAKINDYLRGKLDHTPSSENASNTLVNGVAGLEDISSPKLKSKIQKLLEMKEKGKLKPKMLSNEQSIFRKLSRNSSHKADSDVNKECIDGTALSSDLKAGDRLRKKVFLHYDCQSITSHLDGTSIQNILSRRRNTTTGASAASASLQRSLEDVSSDDSDCGDDRSNDMVLACPFFRNELGGESERVVSLTRSTARQQDRETNETTLLHQPTMACGVAVLENYNWGKRTCPYQRPSVSIENKDWGALYYKNYFKGTDHQSWFGVDDTLGPVAVSVKREKISDDNHNIPGSKSKSLTPSYLYRLIIRTSELAVLRGSVLEDCIPSCIRQPASRGIHPKEILEYIAPELKLSCLRLGNSDSSTEEELVKLDQLSLTNKHKVGIMYCKAGQSTEEEMYNNEIAGNAFTEFLEVIGQRVRLKGFDKYRAGLDVKSDSTGIYSVYSTYQSCEIMFHVSTMLPYTPNNKQQLSRKSRIGNDIVTIVFQEPGALPFTPKNIRSHFQHVFIIVRVINPCSDNTRYRVSVSRSKDVPVFGPAIPPNATFPKSRAFADFLLAKVINAENAAYRSTKFVTMATKTRQGYLKDLATHHVTSTTVETAPKVSVLSFGGSRKKERSVPRIVLDDSVKGAVSWRVLIEDFGLGVTLHCYLGISNSTIVVIEERTKNKIFVCPSLSVMGWSSQSDCIKLYYHQGECLVIKSKDPDDIKAIITRISSVTHGCETEEVTLKRNSIGQLGFHVQPEGIVTEVEQYGLAWQAGLRQGSRLVEICKVAVSTLSHDQMVDLLKTSVIVTITVIPPMKEGSPRRGCTYRNCCYLLLGENGDYENLGMSDTDESLVKSSGDAPSQQTPHSRFRAHSHGRSAGHKLESQLRANRSMVESGRNNRNRQSRKDNLQPERKDQKHHGATRSESPPPLPMRLLDTANISSSSNNPPKYNDIRPPPPPVTLKSHKLAPFPVPVSSTPIRRPSSPPSYQHHQIRHALSSSISTINNTQVANTGNSHHQYHHSTNHSPSSGYHQSGDWTVDTYQKTSSPEPNIIQRKIVNSGLNAGTSSSGDELSLSRGSSPRVNKRDEMSPPKVWVINRTTPRGHNDVGMMMSEVRATTRNKNVMTSNTSTLSSHSSGSSSTFHEDLLRLIDPDLIDPQTDKQQPVEQTSSRESKHKQSVEILLQEMESESSLSNTPSSGGVICTTALPAQVISSASPSPSDHKMSKEERLSPRVTNMAVLSKVKSSPNAKSNVEPVIPLPIPDNEQIDWRSLVDTATKAMQVVKNHPSDTNSGSSSPREVNHSSECEGSSSDKMSPFKDKIKQLEKDLTKEQQKNESLEFEVHQLKEENMKLQEESKAAADQLRRFTEWFFQAIDKQ